MMLAGSLLAAIADARVWRSRWGWASSPTLAASRARARLAWLRLTGVPHSVRAVKHPSRVRGPDGWVGPAGLCADFGRDAAHAEWF